MEVEKILNNYMPTDVSKIIINYIPYIDFKNPKTHIYWSHKIHLQLMVANWCLWLHHSFLWHNKSKKRSFIQWALERCKKDRAFWKKTFGHLNDILSEEVGIINDDSDNYYYFPDNDQPHLTQYVWENMFISEVEYNKARTCNQTLNDTLTLMKEFAEALKCQKSKKIAKVVDLIEKEIKKINAKKPLSIVDFFKKDLTK